MITILLVLMIAFLLVSVGIGWWLSAPGYQGPVSDHFDGKQFVNPGGAKANDLGGVIKWQMESQKVKWEPNMAIPKGENPPFLADTGQVRITFVNHSTFLIQVGEFNILTDPVWSRRVSPFSFAGPERMRPAGLAMSQLPPIHLILLSHNHYDHLDINTLKKLYRKSQPAIICPLGVSKYLHNEGMTSAVEIDWWQQVAVSPELTVHATPAQHFSGRGLFDRDKTLWCGFLLDTPEGKIYFVGDTGYNPIFQEVGQRFAPIRLAMIPIGAYRPEWFMSPVHVSPAQAVQLFEDIRPQRAIAMHFGTFALADEGKDDPANDLRKALAARHIPDSAFIVPEEGKALIFERE